MKLRIFVFLYFVSFWFMTSFSPQAYIYAQHPATQRLANYIKHINRFATDCPQEKVYLHFDNTGYYVGDTIWFKAYTVFAETVKPTTLSRVLHVELVTPRGEIVDSRKLKIVDGQCHGEFALSDDYRGGFYEVRAYTRGMLNFGDDYIFSRVFPVYSAPEISGNYEAKEMDSFFGEKKERPSPATYDKVNLTFFPEGGHAVKGLRSRIAFRSSGSKGEDIRVRGNLYNKSGEQVAVLNTLHQGMGVFELTPEEDEYKAVLEYDGKQYTFPFKEVLPEGYTMHVNNMRSESIQITLQKSSSLPYDTVAVSVSCRGRVYSVEAFGLGEEPYTFSVSKDRFPAGCLQITAFNADGDILAERLAFHTKPDMYIPIRVTQDKPVYKPFEEINMEFDIRDIEGNPVETTFSVAVRDAATTPVTGYQDNMLTNLLLSSEVKGYIENPLQYFTDTSRSTRRKLDLLMMVQGWRRYSWQQMSGVKPFAVNHFVEEGLPLWGRVLTLVGNKPRANADILFWMKNTKGGEIHGKGHTDDKGNFYCILPDSLDITGRWLLNVSVSEKGKQKHSQVLMNRHFSPKRRSYTYLDTFVRDSVVLLAEEEDSLHRPSLMETQVMKEVQVKRYRPRKRLEPQMIFDVDKDINERLDKGEYIPATVQEYAEWEYPILQNSGLKLIQIYLLTCRTEDIPKFRHIDVREIDITNVKRLLMYRKNITELVNNLAKFNAGVDTLVINEKKSYILIVSELYDEVYNDTRKGIRQTYYTGYSPVREYYNLKSSDQAMDDIHYRRTLYWNPDVRTNCKGKANIRFYNNGTCKRMNMSGEGINGNTIISN